MDGAFVAFWNVENLFDVEDWPGRPAWLQKRLAKELKGWTRPVLDRKLAKLAEIIGLMNDRRGPDILGVCEVESRHVLDRLVDALKPLGRAYAIAHADTGDQRGIDVAFLYDGDRFQAGETFSHVILKRTATRDLFQVNFRTTPGGRDLIVIGNHWPSRSGGQLESEPYRMLAGETLAYWHERILEEKGGDVAIVVMGDFNDEPFDSSITQYALAVRDRAKVLNARERPLLLNLMWPLLGAGRATLHFDNWANLLDQFMISRGLVTGKSGFGVRDGSVRIEALPQMTRKGDYPGPIRFGRPSSSGFTGEGYSDHFPVSVVIEAR